MPPFLRLQLALLVTSMAIVPCRPCGLCGSRCSCCSRPCSCLGAGASAGADLGLSSVDDDIHFAMYAGGLDSNLFSEAGLHQCQFDERPLFGPLQELSLLRHDFTTTPSQVNLLQGPVQSMQDTSGSLSGIMNHNLPPIQEYSSQIQHSDASDGHCHAVNPLLHGRSSRVAQEQSTPIRPLAALPTTDRSEIFHEIVEVTESPNGAIVNPDEIHHNEFIGRPPAQGIKSDRFSVPDILQGSVGNVNVLVTGREPTVASLSPVPFRADKCFRRMQPRPVSVKEESLLGVGQVILGEEAASGRQARIFEEGSITGTLLDSGQTTLRESARNVRLMKDREEQSISGLSPVQLPTDEGWMQPASAALAPAPVEEKSQHGLGHAILGEEVTSRSTQIFEDDSTTGFLPFIDVHSMVLLDTGRFCSPEILREGAGNVLSATDRKSTLSGLGPVRFPLNDSFKQSQPLPAPAPEPAKEKAIAGIGGGHVIRGEEVEPERHARIIEDDPNTGVLLENHDRKVEEANPRSRIAPFKKPTGRVHCGCAWAIGGHSEPRDRNQKDVRKTPDYTKSQLQRYQTLNSESKNLRGRSQIQLQDREYGRPQFQAESREITHRGDTFNLSPASTTDVHTSRSKRPVNALLKNENTTYMRKSFSFPTSTSRVVPIAVEQERSVEFSRNPTGRPRLIASHVQSPVLERFGTGEEFDSPNQHFVEKMSSLTVKKDLDMSPYLNSFRGGQKQTIAEKDSRGFSPVPSMPTEREPPWSPAREEWRLPHKLKSIKTTTIASERDSRSGWPQSALPTERQPPREEWTLPPTLSEIPYDAFPYSEATDADAGRIPSEGSVIAGNVTQSSPIPTPAPAPKIEQGSGEKEFERKASPVKVKKKTTAKPTAETTTKVAVKTATTVAAGNGSSAGGIGDGDGDGPCALQICRCEPGGSCSCSSVDRLCHRVGLRVAEDVGEFVKKEAVSALKVIRDLKLAP